MLRILSALVCAVVAASAADAWKPVAGVVVQPDGRIQAGGLVLNLQHYDDGWASTTADKAVAETGGLVGGTWIRRGEWKTASATGKLAEKMLLADGRLRVDGQLADLPGKVFCLSIPLPGAQFRGKELRIDGTALALPAESPQPTLHTSAAKSVEIPLAAGGSLEISGELKVFIQDNKTWKSDSFAIRILADAQQHVIADLRIKP